MPRSSMRLRTLQVYLSRAVAFLLTILLVWYTMVELPRLIFNGWILQPGAYQISIVTIATLHYLPALSLGFWVAVVVRSLNILRGYLVFARGRAIPPYESVPETELPVLRKKVDTTQKKLRNTAYSLIVSLVFLIGIGYLYYSSLMWYPDRVAQILESLDSNLIVAVGSAVLTAPVQPFVGTGPMNSESLVATTLLIWVPTVPLTVFFLNLNSYLYDRIRSLIFGWANEPTRVEE